MAIEILDPDSQIPDPRNERALYFSEATRGLFRNKIANVAKQGDHQLFLESEDGLTCTVGLVSIQQVTSINAAGVGLSNSHALHGLGKDVGPLEDSQWYEMAIDPSSNVILWAKATASREVRNGYPLQVFEIDPEALPSLSQTQAENLFSSVQRQPHIPFEYPADGCWARAHEMCRLIECFFDKNPQDVVAKIWNIAERSLRVETDNNPKCTVEWSHHVAPLIKVGCTLTVIDPSLFGKPVTAEQWAGVQGDPQAARVHTCRHAYKPRSLGSQTFRREIPGESAAELQRHESLLTAMIYCHGPIPYKCEDYTSLKT